MEQRKHKLTDLQTDKEIKTCTIATATNIQRSGPEQRKTWQINTEGGDTKQRLDVAISNRKPGATQEVHTTE